MRSAIIALLTFVTFATSQNSTFVNPLLPSGPDPFVTFHDGFYYYMHTTGNNLTIWRTRDITELRNAEKKVVWRPPASGPYSRDIWAPELQLIGGKWYIYFAADDGRNETHRIWVLENASADPLGGEWVMKGKVSDSADRWAIDATAFENRGQLYLAWSGWPGDRDGEQDIYIARLRNPWTVEGSRVRLSSPRFGWEKHGDLPDRHVNVNEGPEVLFHGSSVFLIYTGSACWTDYYGLGILQASANDDLMNPSAWKKAERPIFESSRPAHAFGVGHNSFFKSPDGKEDWIAYHANPEANQGCVNLRSPRIQPFTWRADGTPDLGKPVPLGVAIPKPSGQQ